MILGRECSSLLFYLSWVSAVLRWLWFPHGFVSKFMLVYIRTFLVYNNECIHSIKQPCIYIYWRKTIYSRNTYAQVSLYENWTLQKWKWLKVVWNHAEDQQWLVSWRHMGTWSYNTIPNFIYEIKDPAQIGWWCVWTPKYSGVVVEHPPVAQPQTYVPLALKDAVNVRFRAEYGRINNIIYELIFRLF